MISTVTTTVVTILTLTIGATLSALAATFLIVLLGTKELVTADARQSLRMFGRRLDIAILPLLISFTFVVAIKVAEILL